MFSFKRWALALVGSLPWRNWGVAFAVLGWSVSGFRLGVRSVAMRRAALWQLPDGDLYKDMFLDALACPDSWAAKSTLLLQKFGIPDWGVWNSSYKSLDAYRSMVNELLRSSFLPVWTQATSTHSAKVPLLSFAERPFDTLKLMRRSGMEWRLHHGVGTFSQLRAGLLLLAGRDGRSSQARLQNCFCCQEVVENATVHTLIFCRHWSRHRTAFLQMAAGLQGLVPSDLARGILAYPPTGPGFELLMEWMLQLREKR